METKNLPVIKKSDVPGTLRSLPRRSRWWTKAIDFAPITTVRVAIGRLNAEAEKNIYTVEMENNGESYIIIKS